MVRLDELLDVPAITVAADASLAQAARVMYENGTGSLCVVDTGDLVGIFTERDLLRACAAGIETDRSTVGSWMTEDPTTSRPDVDAADAMELMIERGFRHLPVLDDGGRLLGVVSMRRLSRALRPRG